jgi:hypothetical protein
MIFQKIKILWFCLYGLLPVISVFRVKRHYTPILSFLPNLHLHDVVILSDELNTPPNLLLSNTKSNTNTNVLKDVFMVDFSPAQALNFTEIVKLCFGLSIPGIVRVIYFETLAKENITTEWYKQKQDQPPYKDVELPFSNCSHFITEWDSSFHLYNHNCKHFSKYFIHNVEQILTGINVL